VPAPIQLPRGFDSSAFLRLALPMIISRAGLAAMGIADGIMVSRFGPHQFAWLSLAEGTLGRLLDIFIAFIIGGLSLVPRYFAQGDARAARTIWLRAVPMAFVLGISALLLSLFGTPLLKAVGQKTELATGAGPVMTILGAGYPAALIAISAALYLEGLNRPRMVAVSVIGGNVLNIFFNWMLIGGHLGFPALGARGSAWSTTIVRFALCGVLAGCAWRLRGSGTESGEQLAVNPVVSKRLQWKLGLGAASTVAAMVALSSWLTIFAGWLGILPLAVFSACLSLAAPAGLVGLGMADAAGIYVAAEAGRGGERSAASVAWASLRVTLGAIAVLVVILLGGAAKLAALYTHDSAMRVAILASIPIVALTLSVDCAGFVMAASLRAIREVKWPVSIEIGSMLLLVPLAMSIAFSRGYGVRGLFMAMLGAACLRAAMLAWRFWWRTRSATEQPEAPAPEVEYQC
jgi:multidrug resistance protein, MATE family